MSGFNAPTYTQIPNDLFEMMAEMNAAELKVILYLCRMTFGYHRDEIKISTRKLADEIGMSVASVQAGAEQLEGRGLIERVNDGQQSTVWRVVVGDSIFSTPKQKVYQKLAHGVSEIESQVGLKKDKEINKKSTANVFRAYEGDIGIITSTIATELQALQDQYSEQWVIDGVKVCAERNKRSLSYLKGILRRWHVDGRDNKATATSADKIYHAEPEGEYVLPPHMRK